MRSVGLIIATAAALATITVGTIVARPGWAGDPVSKEKLQDFQRPDPLEGLTDEEANAYTDAALEASKARAIDFAEREFPLMGVPVASLERAEFTGDYVPAFESIEDSARGADIIVRVKVRQIRFEGLFSAVTTADVVEVLKGENQSSIIFEQTGSVANIDGEPVLLESSSAPLLVPGDEAFVFLVSDHVLAKGVPTRVLPFTGWFKVDTGGVRAPAYAQPLLESFAMGGGVTTFARSVTELLAK